MAVSICKITSIVIPDKFNSTSLLPRLYTSCSSLFFWPNVRVHYLTVENLANKHLPVYAFSFVTTFVLVPLINGAFLTWRMFSLNVRQYLHDVAVKAREPESFELSHIRFDMASSVPRQPPPPALLRNSATQTWLTSCS